MINDRNVMQRGNAIVAQTPLLSLIDEAVRYLDRTAILEIGDKISQAIAPLTPCKNGCSHCCYMGVAITEFEANQIAEYTKRSIVEFPDPQEYMETFKAETYATVPCTFLEDGKCTVYPVRPLACRLHHNLADDATNCEIRLPLETMEVTPSLNLNEVNFWFVNLALRNNEAIGDIRDFFPRV